MTKEEAIKRLKRVKRIAGGDLPIAFDMGIEALEKQEPCEDCVSRQAVLSKIKEVCFGEEWVKFRIDNGSNGQRDFLTNYIEQLPPVTPQPKIGKWIGIEYDSYADGNPVYDVYECSLCGFEHKGESDTLTDYCPDCGAKMEENRNA